MSKLVKVAPKAFTYTITETTDTGRFYVTSTLGGINDSTTVYIAENEADIRTWLRTHPNVVNPTVRVTSRKLVAEGVGEGQDWGTGHSFTFSSKVTDPELGGGALKRFGSSALNRLFLKSMLKKALAAGSPEGKHPDFTLMPTATGTFGGKEEPSHTVIVHGDVDPKTIAGSLADHFKQRAVATSTTTPVTGYVKEGTDMAEDKITESMFQTGDSNTLSGQAQLDYRNMLAGEIFGAAAFSTQRPTADTHESVNTVMDTQTVEGMGVMRPVGAPAANMNEDTSFNKHMLNMAKSLFRANRMDEAAKVVDAIDSPSTAAAKVLEAAIATDGVVDEKLTEDLYNAAAYFSTLTKEQSIRPVDMLFMESGVRFKENRPVSGAYTVHDAAREQGKTLKGEKYDPSTAKHLETERAEASKEK